MADPTRRLANMDNVGAGDIAVGQQWVPMVTEVQYRVPWTVIERRTDKVIVERNGEQQRVTFGSLLALWALVAR